MNNDKHLRWSARTIAGGTFALWTLLGVLGGFLMKVPGVDGFAGHMVFWYSLLASLPVEIVHGWFVDPEMRGTVFEPWGLIVAAGCVFWSLQALAWVRRRKWLAAVLLAYTIVSVWTLLAAAVMGSFRNQ